MAWAGLIVLTIVIFLSIACCIRCCCKDKKHGDCAPAKKKATMVEMQDAPADERCDTARPMNHYMQTEGPEDEESPSGRNPSSTENVVPESANGDEEAKREDIVDEAPPEEKADGNDEEKADEQAPLEEEIAPIEEADNEV